MTLATVKHQLTNPAEQVKIIEGARSLFPEKLINEGLHPLKSQGIDVFQVNVGKMCNQTCKHCHVDAGPDRKEIISKETLQKCLEILSNSPTPKIDITGGAPEMNPHFRWFVEECRKLNKHVMVRCNLTIIVANKKYYDLPDFYARHKVEVISSLPYFNADRTDRQRGSGVFERSVKALKMLNSVGYGKAESDLKLNLVYNPVGAFLPGPQSSLEAQFKRTLKKEFDIDFDNLFAITNLPVSRFLEFLVDSGNYESYQEKLINAFNPSAAASVMCRNTISVGWDGYLYDCDFNQMLELKVKSKSRHLNDFDFEALSNREIVHNNHCFGCTAGAGSSCGGSTVSETASQ